MSDQIILSDEDVISMAQDANFAEASTLTGEELIFHWMICDRT